MLPFLVVSEVWNGSDPEALLENRRESWPPKLVLAVWACFDGFFLLAFIASACESAKLEALAAAGMVLALVVLTLCSVLGFVVVFRISAMQRAANRPAQGNASPVGLFSPCLCGSGA